MTKFFGLADITASLLFLAKFYHVGLPKGLVIAVGIYLALKGIVFIANFFSWIDIFAGIMLLTGWAPPFYPFILLGIAAFLGIKGIASLFTFS